MGCKSVPLIFQFVKDFCVVMFSGEHIIRRIWNKTRYKHCLLYNNHALWYFGKWFARIIRDDPLDGGFHNRRSFKVIQLNSEVFPSKASRTPRFEATPPKGR